MQIAAEEYIRVKKLPMEKELIMAQESGEQLAEFIFKYKNRLKAAEF